MNAKGMLAILLFLTIMSGYVVLKSKPLNSSNPLHTLTIEKITEDNIISDTSPCETFNKIRDLIKTLPECPLKSNLLIIIATEYAGDSSYLNDLLQDYAKQQILNLSSKNKT